MKTQTPMVRLATAGRSTLLAALALTLGGCVVVPAHRYDGPQSGSYDSYGGAAPPPPPPQVEYYGPPPVVGYIWIGGFWRWLGGRHVWSPGRWEAPRGGHGRR